MNSEPFFASEVLSIRKKCRRFRLSLVAVVIDIFGKKSTTMTDLFNGSTLGAGPAAMGSTVGGVGLATPTVCNRCHAVNPQGLKCALQGCMTGLCHTCSTKLNIVKSRFPVIRKLEDIMDPCNAELTCVDCLSEAQGATQHLELEAVKKGM